MQLKQSQMMLQNEEDKVAIMRDMHWSLTQSLHQPIVIMETPPTGAVSEEEHYELQETMGLLQQELADLQVTASSNEATIRKLSEPVSSQFIMCGSGKFFCIQQELFCYVSDFHISSVLGGMVIANHLLELLKLWMSHFIIWHLGQHNYFCW